MEGLINIIASAINKIRKKIAKTLDKDYLESKFISFKIVWYRNFNYKDIITEEDWT
jgi:hypothetical protein